MKQRYSLGVSVNDDGSINYAGLNDNSNGSYVLSGDSQFPLFVHERIALLKVADTYKAVMLGIGRKLVDGLYTVYINKDEYKELYKLRKSADDSRKKGKK
jgi:hypothetical protein